MYTEATYLSMNVGSIRITGERQHNNKRPIPALSTLRMSRVVDS